MTRVRVAQRVLLSAEMRSTLETIQYEGRVMWNARPFYNPFYDVLDDGLCRKTDAQYMMAPASWCNLHAINDSIVAEHILTAGYVCTTKLSTCPECVPVNFEGTDWRDAHARYCLAYACVLRNNLGIAFNEGRVVRLKKEKKGRRVNKK